MSESLDHESDLRQDAISGSPVSEGNRTPFPVSAAVAFTLLGLWGCLSIYTACAFRELPGYFAGRQLMWLCLGCLLFIGAARLKFSLWLHARTLLAGISVAGLAAVLVFGSRINGMRGWFLYGDMLSFQPAEFAKPFFLLYCCGEFSAWIRNRESGTPDPASASIRSLVRAFGAAALFCLLILLEPDFGTCLVFAVSFLTLYWLAGGKTWHIFLIGLTVLAASGLFLWKIPYAWNRIGAFFSANPDLYRGTWHMRQFRYALSQGGLGGSEHGAAVWSNAYLPLAHSDSIYAAIVESTGLLGGLLVLGVFAAILVVFFRMAQKKDLTVSARLFISGAAILYGFQALLHISVNVVLLPPTGITLPVLSYGGSSLVSTLLAFGMVFSAGQVEKREETQEKHEKKRKNQETDS